MFIVDNRKIFYTLSFLLVAISVFMLARFGLNFGTDFTGGTILEVEFPAERPSIAEVEESLAGVALESLVLQPTGERGLLIRTKIIAEQERAIILDNLNELVGAEVVEKRFSAVGPTLGQELAKKGLIAMLLVVILLLLYIALVFRRVSKPVSSWVYGLVLVITMVHDVIIPTGVFSYLGVRAGIEIDALFLTAFLTILGLSVNDKIVAFDRIRENLRRQPTSEKFGETVGRSLNETLTRSINTSLTVLIVLASLFFFGGESTKYFALAMGLGMVVATYSSIFLAAPLLASWNARRR